MCQNYKYNKVTQNQLSHITVCQNGMIHVHSGDATMHFSQQDFVSLIQAGQKICEHLLTKVTQPLH